MSKYAYVVFNLVFAGIIACIFIYSAIYSPDRNDHPIKCIHEVLLGSKCPTCGMSRGFSAIVRGRTEDAHQLQPNSIRVFWFFMIQWIMRIILIICLLKTHISVNHFVQVDIPLSVGLFLFTFGNIILQTFYIFYKMLI